MKEISITISFMFLTGLLSMNVTGNPIRSILSVKESSFSSTAEPSKSAIVEYLESTGTQWIDSEIIGQSPLRVSLGFKASEIGGDKTIIGTGGGSDRLYFGMNGNRWFFGYSSYTYGTSADTQYHDFTIVWKPNGAFLEIDGNENIRIQSSRIVKYSKTIGILTRNIGGSLNYCVKGRLYYCKIYNEIDQMILDLVPIRFQNEDGEQEGAMYDQLSGKVFRNVGTGKFLYGKDVSQLDI